MARAPRKSSWSVPDMLNTPRIPQPVLTELRAIAGPENLRLADGELAVYARQRVLDPKLDQIEAAGIDYVVAVNPGCLRQLRQGLRRRKSNVRAVHIADLLRRAAR